MSLDDKAWKVLTPLGSGRTANAPFMLDEAALPYAAIAYAQAGEDLAVRRLFKWRIKNGQMGTYVDLGCGQPDSISNTYLFYCLGWRGVCVDANNQFAANWKARRPEDTFLNVAIGQRPGTGYLFKHKLNDGMSRVAATAEPPSALFWSDAKEVPIMRLDAVFEKHLGDKKIQFISMDLEGAELDVLQSNDWERWRPEAILMECLDCDLVGPDKEPTIQFLANLGYKFHSKIFNNVLMVEPYLFETGGI